MDQNQPNGATPPRQSSPPSPIIVPGQNQPIIDSKGNLVPQGQPGLDEIALARQQAEAAAQAAEHARAVAHRATSQKVRAMILDDGEDAKSEPLVCHCGCEDFVDRSRIRKLDLSHLDEKDKEVLGLGKNEAPLSDRYFSFVVCADCNLMPREMWDTLEEQGRKELARYNPDNYEPDSKS